MAPDSQHHRTLVQSCDLSRLPDEGRMRRCSQCILPENLPGIDLDAENRCRQCREHRPLKAAGAAALEQEIARLDRAAGRYAALVPVSGGKDSAYVLLQMSKLLGRRLLAYNYDNGLTHPQAQENLAQMSRRLGIALITRRNPHQRDYFSANLRAWLRRPDPAMVPMLCTGCRYGIVGNAFKVAREYRIPMVVIGWSPIEDTPFKEALLRRGSGSVLMGLARQLLANPAYARPGNLWHAALDWFHNYAHVANGSVFLRRRYPGVHLIQYYNYVPYNPDLIQRQVEAELGWRAPERKNSWQFDCKIKLVQNYLYHRSASYTALDGYLSAMVRENYISRDEALRRLEYAHRYPQESLERLHDFLCQTGNDDLVPYFNGEEQSN